MKITIYTDGAAKGNPGRAGWGAVIIFGDNDKLKVRKVIKLKVLEIGGFSSHATNNIMELTAPIKALKYILARQDLAKSNIEIISDSKYVILGITEWIGNWVKNNWRNAQKKPVMNRELWEELYELNQELKPKWAYVKGHHEDKYNHRADLIATSFAEGEPVKLENAG
ncbi:MAG TPA: ribonuclease H [Candidatus Paceibacterota bacterium]